LRGLEKIPDAASGRSQSRSQRTLWLDFSAKAASLESIAQALSRGDIIHAQIATLHLQIPNPPTLAKALQAAVEVVALANDLRASRLQGGLGPG
jgi:hypothetical protein